VTTQDENEEEEDEDEDEDDEEEVEAESNTRRGGFPNRPRLLKQEVLNLDLDDDMSGSSLSMSSSTTSLLAFESEPVKPIAADNNTSDVTTTPSAAATTDEQQAQTDLSAAVVTAAGTNDNVGEHETHGMDVDTPRPPRSDNDDNNENKTNGMVLTSTVTALRVDPTATALRVDPTTTDSLSLTEEKLVVVDRDMDMASGEPVINGVSSSPVSPSTATPAPTTGQAQPTDEAVIPDQDSSTSSTAPEDQGLEPIKESSPSPPPVLFLDVSEVSCLRQALVDKTDTSTVEELDQLRAALYEDLWQHRLQWDKGPMLQVNRKKNALISENSDSSSAHTSNALFSPSPPFFLYLA
jgi:hypothetical protein